MYDKGGLDPLLVLGRASVGWNWSMYVVPMYDKGDWTLDFAYIWKGVGWGWKFCSSMIHELDILLALGRAEWGAPRVRSFLW